MSKKIIIGSRGSKLALLYAQQAKDKIIENTDLGNEDIIIKSIFSMCERAASSGTTPPKSLWTSTWLEIIFDKTIGNPSSFSVIKEAAVSSQLDSIPRIKGFLLIQIVFNNCTIFIQVRNNFFMRKKIIIGSRGSKLALLYAQQAKDKIIENTNLGNEDILIKSIKTKGDEVQDIRLSELGGKGLFSSNIEKELQLKNIDIAVHALKDMPANETEGLRTNSFLERNDPREILITKDKKKLKDLDQKSIVGTSSYRREFQIKKIRQDLNCKLIRGNVDTRIRKLNEGMYDAIILSYAGIKFLKFENEISEIFSAEEIIPSAGQGIIALQCRENDDEIISILNKINHEETHKRAHLERNILKVLDGDCETAIGAHSVVDEAELFSLDGKQRFYEKKVGNLNEFKEIGKEIGILLKTKSNNSYKR